MRLRDPLIPSRRRGPRRFARLRAALAPRRRAGHRG
jgi:hypothetical protein